MVEGHVQIFARLCPSESNHLLLKMQISKVLNPHSPTKEEILFAMFVRDFHLKFLGKCLIKTFR